MVTKVPVMIKKLHFQVMKNLKTNALTACLKMKATIQSSAQLYIPRGFFSDNNVETIFRLCNDMIESSAPISEKSISNRFTNDKAGKIMLKKVGMQAIINRVKYERRKIRNKHKKSY